MPAHRDLIVEQFTKQAVPFSTAPGVRDEEALRLLVDFAGAGPDDTVLDVACGPGLVVCALAAVVRHATGIDVTPAMIERAAGARGGEGARERRLANRRRVAASLSGRRVLARRLALRVPSLSRAARRARGDETRVRAGRAGRAGGRRGVGGPGEGGGAQPHGEAPRSVPRARAHAGGAAFALSRRRPPSAARDLLPAQVGAGGAARAVVPGAGGRGADPAHVHRLARGRRAGPGDATARE